MKNNTQTIITSILLALVVVALLAYDDWDAWLGGKTVTAVQEAQPDLIAHDVEQVHFGTDGLLNYRLQATEMQQFLQANRNQIQQPDILFYRQQQPAWETTADTGHSDTTGDELHLRGNVTITQKGGETPGATLKTDTLTLFPRESRAQTDDKVTIRQPGFYIEGLGLEANLNTNQLTLLHQVTSIYEPEKS